MSESTEQLQRRVRELAAENEELTARLRDVTERDRTLVDNLGIGVYSLSDPIAGILGSVNPATARIFGYDSVEEVMALGSSFIVYENPEDRIRFVKSLIANEFKDSKTVSFEARLLKKDRTPIWTRIVAHATFDDSNRMIRVDGAIEDVTAQRQAEAALRESEQRFRQVFETAAVGIVLNDRHGMIVQANPAFCRFIGYTEEDLIGRSSEELTHPDHLQETLDRTAELRDGRVGIFNMEKRYLRKDGAEIWGHTTVTLLVDSQEHQSSGIAMIQDITERKHMEMDLLRIQKLESLAVLAGGIAHDFNNILTGVLGNVSLARTFASGDARQEARLLRAEQAAMRARDLTRQLQTFARGGEPARRISSLTKLLRETAEFSLRGSKVHYDLEIAEDAWCAEIDSGQIGQVLSNLLINAQQAMPDGGQVTLGLENLELPPEAPVPLPPGRYLLVTVQDQGVGIREADLGRIFDPYFTTKNTGSGLGLATSYSIIRKHDGFVGVESQVDVGSRFSIYLPAAAPGVQVEEPGEATGPRRGSGRILLMDDEDIIAETDSAILEEYGYEVVTVRDGAEVLPRYREAEQEGRPFRLVIMDLTVPNGLGGAEVIGDLLAHDASAYALVSSGYSKAPIMSEYRRWGFRAALSKPHSAEELLRAVEDALQGDD